jgi:hypothetical protein
MRIIHRDSKEWAIAKKKAVNVFVGSEVSVYCDTFIEIIDEMYWGTGQLWNNGDLYFEWSV